MDTIFQILESPVFATVFTVAGAVVLLGFVVSQWLDIRRMRAYSATLGLPLTPPASRMRLAQWVEAMQPTMAGLAACAGTAAGHRGDARPRPARLSGQPARVGRNSATPSQLH